MSDDVSMEQKLELVRQIRSRYHENQYDMDNRERILYGRQTQRTDGYSAGGGEPEAPTRVSFFRLRLLAALLLFLTVVIMDVNKLNLAGITTEEIFRAISADYEDKIDEWVETLAAAYNSPDK